MTQDALGRVLAYHERSKHHPQRYAASLGYLDWANQPDPFRTYEGALVTPLPLTAAGLDAPFEALYAPGALPPRPLDRGTLSAFFELTLGLSAWKQAGGSRWALRCNPSSGNLHPTEGYLVCRGILDIVDGVHHYVSRDHVLERRCPITPPLPAGAFLFGLSSIPWREAWKYGERAYRYCQHDAGHAIAAARYAAAVLGWSAALLDVPGDDDLAALLGLDRADGGHPSEGEHPDALMVVGIPPLTLDLDLDALIAATGTAAWSGRPNRLSEDHALWPVIDDVAEAARKPRLPAGPHVGQAVRIHSPPPHPTPNAQRPTPNAQGPTLKAQLSSPAASAIIRQRRSAVDFDGKTGITTGDLYQMLQRVVPHAGKPPWDALPWAPRIHPTLMLHRVVGLAPGLYALSRAPAATEGLRAAMAPRFLWQRPESCPPELELYLLQEGDARDAARTLSCHQDIAADGAFTLGMLADFAGTLREHGAWRYRQLFWEAGVLGQVLYLEAEALGVRATGIGCYFDDLFHGLLGLEDHRFQSLYHFTVGGPVEDPRLETLPPYGHLCR
jgi:nitroreductase